MIEHELLVSVRHTFAFRRLLSVVRQRAWLGNLILRTRGSHCVSAESRSVAMCERVCRQGLSLIRCPSDTGSVVRGSQDASEPACRPTRNGLFLGFVGKKGASDARLAPLLSPHIARGRSHGRTAHDEPQGNKDGHQLEQQESILRG